MGVAIMTEIKVDNVQNAAGSGKPNFPISPTHSGGSALTTLNTYSYTSSGTEPSSPKNGALWWDSANEKVKVYIAGEFKEISLNASSSSGVAWGGTRGFYIGQTNAIEYVDLTSPGNATDFGDLATAQNENCSAAGNKVRAVVRSGTVSGNWPSGWVDTIEYFACATTGNASDFGNSALHLNRTSAVGDGTKAIFGTGAGGPSGGSYTQSNNIIEYVTVASTGNATDFGDLTVGRNGAAATNDDTRGVFVGGYTGSGINTMDYITMGTTGNATDFGDTLGSMLIYPGVGCISNNTIGCMTHGYHESSSWTKTNIIQKITIQTTGNATDFGDATGGNVNTGNNSDGTTGTMAGGSGTSDNRIDKITIATPGNATDFGDLTVHTDSTPFYAGCGMSGNAS